MSVPLHRVMTSAAASTTHRALQHIGVLTRKVADAVHTGLYALPHCVNM